MSLTLIIRDMQIIQASSLSLENKEILTKTKHTAADWTSEQKEMFDSAIDDWDRNHPRVQKTLPNGRKFWVDKDSTNQKD